MSTKKIIIAGAGQAGAQCAVSLRQAGHTGPLTLIGAEPELPYQRPPLSKAYLKGEMEGARLALRPAEFYSGQNIDVHTDNAVTAIDRKARSVTLTSGENLSYEKLLLATGAPPRKLDCAGANLAGIHYLRTLKDSDQLRTILDRAGRIVIVGAGYIGLEVAAVMRSYGREVCVIEFADRPLARVASPEVSNFFTDLHRDAGIDFRFNECVTGFEGDTHVERAVLQNGDTIDCCGALVGIGALPNIDIAVNAGLDVDNGIIVDEHTRTSDPDIFAAGDCSNFPSPRYDCRLRLESVPNAIEQSKVAAANMIGGEVVYDALPWFWSDQYDVKLQTVGLLGGYDQAIVRGDMAAKAFSVWYLRKGTLLAVDAINDPAAFAIGRKLLMTGASVDADALGDLNRELKSLIAR